MPFVRLRYTFINETTIAGNASVACSHVARIPVKWLTGYSRYVGGFNYLGEGNFFGQIGEIRISNVRRYGH